MCGGVDFSPMLLRFVGARGVNFVCARAVSLLASARSLVACSFDRLLLLVLLTIWCVW